RVEALGALAWVRERVPRSAWLPTSESQVRLVELMVDGPPPGPAGGTEWGALLEKARPHTLDDEYLEILAAAIAWSLGAARLPSAFMWLSEAESRLSAAPLWRERIGALRARAVASAATLSRGGVAGAATPLGIP
ncbi:MAG TPA: hypothetical protein VEY30_04185, partial [Myxococcaceae bacterium]|nr:hypothetical protein [Myxococcaceae bacterium]